MSLTLTPDVLDKNMPGTSMASQLANHLRQALADHDLEPGAFFPSEEQLSKAVGLSRPTVRESLRELELEGLIVRRMGARTRVAIPPPVRYYDVLRYARASEALDRGETPPASFVEDFGAEDEDYTIEPREITKEPASPQDAEYLRVRRGTPILRRRMVQNLSGDPIQIHRQAMIHKQVKDSDLALRIDRAGILAELWAAGIRPTHYAEWWKPRNPNRTERELLGLRVSISCWEGVRVFYVADDPDRDNTDDLTPVQVSKIITPGNRMTLHVSGRLTPHPAPGAETSAD
jgi:DNA-binding GntR family transcriptional regulator